MAPKLPGKFDDISKPAASVLGDDFQCKDFQLKTKTKTNLNGATVEGTVDLFAGAGNATKLSCKFPKPFAFLGFKPLEGFAIDKFDLDKAGLAKVECSAGKALHGVDGLKLQINADVGNSLTEPKNFAYSLTHTGIENTSVKVETKQADPTNFTAELLHGRGPAVIGVKFNGISNLCPSVGANYVQGDIFASVIAKEKFSEFTAHLLYKVAADIQVAATYQQGGKTSGAYSTGCTFPVSALGASAKAKFDSSNTLSVAFKKELAKGTTLLGGASYKDGNLTYGAKVSVE